MLIFLTIIGVWFPDKVRPAKPGRASWWFARTVPAGGRDAPGPWHMLAGHTAACRYRLGGGGVAVMVAWFVRASVILRYGSQNPMSFNTALAFVVTGLALVALARRRPRA